MQRDERRRLVREAEQKVAQLLAKLEDAIGRPIESIEVDTRNFTRGTVSIGYAGDLADG